MEEIALSFNLNTLTYDLYRYFDVFGYVFELSCCTNNSAVRFVITVVNVFSFKKKEN